QSSLGFAEVAIGDEDVTVDEAIRVPTDLLDAAGADAIDHPLAFAFTRQRQDPTDVTRNDEETRLTRLFSLPTGRSFSLTGDARRPSRSVPRLRGEVLGRPHDGSVTWARSSTGLTGSTATPAAAFDGDPSTAWTTVRAQPNRQWVEVVLPEEATIESLPLTV